MGREQGAPQGADPWEARGWRICQLCPQWGNWSRQQLSSTEMSSYISAQQHVVEADCYCSFTQGQEDEIESGNAWATWLPYNTDRLSRGRQASGTSHLLQEGSLQAAASHSAGAAPALMAAPKTPCSDRFLPPQVLQVVIFHILFHFDFLMALGGHLTRVSGQWICHSLHLHAHQRSLPNLIHLVWALISCRAILESSHKSATLKTPKAERSARTQFVSSAHRNLGSGSVAVRKRLGSSASSADTCYSSCWRSNLHFSPKLPPSRMPHAEAPCTNGMGKAWTWSKPHISCWAPEAPRPATSLLTRAENSSCSWGKQQPTLFSPAAPFCCCCFFKMLSALSISKARGDPAAFDTPRAFFF